MNGTGGAQALGPHPPHTPEPAVASQIIHHLLSLRARAACVDRRSGHGAVRGTGWDLTTYRGTAGASVVYPLGMARGRSYPPRGRLDGTGLGPSI